MVTENKIEDMSNEELGKCTKNIMLFWQKEFEKTKSDPGQAISFYAAILWLGWIMRDTNADEFKTSIQGLTNKGEPQGNFELIIRKKGYISENYTLWDYIYSPFRKLLGKGPRQFGYWYKN